MSYSEKDVQELIESAIGCEPYFCVIPCRAKDRLKLAIKPFKKKPKRVVYGHKWVNDESFVIAGSKSTDPTLRSKEVSFVEYDDEVRAALAAAGIEVEG